MTTSPFPASQTIAIKSSAPIWNLTVNGANFPVAQSDSIGLTVKGNLTLTSGTLNANNLSLADTQVTGVTSFSDFAIGETAVDSVSTSSSAFGFGTNPVNPWLTPQSSTVTNDGNITANLAGQLTQFTDGSSPWSIVYHI